MKWVKRIGIGLGILLVVLVLFYNFYLGRAVKLGLERGGPIALGVPVKLEEAHFRLLRGLVTLKGFVIGNPEGFKSEHAISVGEITVELVPRSVFTDTILIKRIHVKTPDIIYELGLGKSNIGVIGDKAAGEKQPEGEKPRAETGRSQKKVIIEDLLIEDGKVKVAGVPIALPTIHLTNIGKDQGGTSTAEIVKNVFGAIASSVTGVATGAGRLATEGAEAVREAAKSTGKAVGDAVKGIFGK